MADLERQTMPEQAPEIRRHNFSEVALGYTPAQAEAEARRCLNCKNAPCMQGCPVSVRIPAFIACIARGDYAAAYETVTATNALPAVCGRVCPQERQCEARCVRGIKGKSVAIGALERFAADQHAEEETAAPAGNKNGKKIAVVGSGPSGLTAAGDLVRLGYDVTVYEAFHTAGGVLMYGIPEFRLPKAIVQKEIRRLRALGVHIETNVIVGKTLTVDELLTEMGCDAVYIGTGAGLPSFLGGEANLGRGMAAFARKTGSPIILAKIRREGLAQGDYGRLYRQGSQGPRLSARGEGGGREVRRVPEGRGRQDARRLEPRRAFRAQAGLRGVRR